MSAAAKCCATGTATRSDRIGAVSDETEREAHRREVAANRAYFLLVVGTLIPEHLGRFVLLKSRTIVDIFDKASDAYRVGVERYGALGFSIEEVTESDDDRQYRRAVALVRANQKASISWLQRQLRIGFNSASRLTDRMEQDGIFRQPD